MYSGWEVDGRGGPYKYGNFVNQVSRRSVVEFFKATLFPGSTSGDVFEAEHEVFATQLTVRSVPLVD